jgi:hypothetical protein
MKTSLKILKTIICIVLTTIVCNAFGQKPLLCCIDFNKSTTFPRGATYKNPNDSITSFCWYETRTDKLEINGNTYYNFGRLEQAPPNFGSGQVFNTNNSALKFTAIGIAKPVVITFDYLDMGGTENLSINGHLYIGELNKAPISFGNVTVSITSNPVPLPAKGKSGTVTITGLVKEFKIGGQEFYLDNVCFAIARNEKMAIEMKTIWPCFGLLSFK